MDVMQSIPFDDLPAFSQIVLYFCLGCLLLVLVGLCIIAVLFTVTGVITIIDNIIDDIKRKE